MPDKGNTLRHLKALSGQGAEGPSDQELLVRFVAERAESAFASLLERHGPMVLGVCRRTVGDEHLAEDVFQATFLVLARNAASIVEQRSVGSWLHGVALRLGRKARAQAARRQWGDPRGPAGAAPDPQAEASWREAAEALDAELQRLPDAYRLPLVLCYLEGRTRDEAAAQLGWTVSKLKGMLERGRERLRRRLERRGIGLAGAGATVLLADTALAAAVPPLLAVATVGAGLGGALPAMVEILAASEGGPNMLANTKLRIGVALVCVLAMVGAGVAVVAPRGDEGLDETVPVALAPAEEEKKAVPPPPAPLPVPKKAKLVARWENSAGHRGGEWLVGFSRDSKLAFFEQESKRTIARDVTTWKRTGLVLVNEDDLKPPRSGLTATSRDGALCVSGVEASDRGKKGWYDLVLEDAKTKKILTRIPGHPGPPQFLFTPDGKSLISAAHDAIVFWDVPKLTRRRTLGPVNTTPVNVLLRPDGKVLGLRCQGVSYEDQFWDLATGKMVASLGSHGIGHYPVQVWSLAFAPDGKRLFSSGNDPQLKAWDMKTGLSALTIPVDFNSRNGITKVVAGPRGDVVAVSEGLVVRLYDAATGKPGAVLEGHTGRINDLAFSPDGKAIISASGRPPLKYGFLREAEPGEVIVWDLVTKKARHTLRPYKQGCHAVAWHPDGKRFASGGVVPPADDTGPATREEGLFVWDAKTGKRLATLDLGKHGAGPLAFNPDGKTLAHGGTRIVDLATGKEVRSLYTGAGALAFRKDGRLLVVAGANYIGLWDPRTGEEVGRHMGSDKQSINAVAFHPDGTAVATGSNASEVWLYDIVPVAAK